MLWSHKSPEPKRTGNSKIQILDLNDLGVIADSPGFPPGVELYAVERSRSSFLNLHAAWGPLSYLLLVFSSCEKKR